MIAHRGDWLEGDDPGPQNSIGAVLSALAAGADGAEVDARLSADGTVVLHHDPGIGTADLELGCEAAAGTPLCLLADRALRHLGTLAELLSALAERGSPAWGTAPGSPAVLNIELKDLPGEPGGDGRHLLAQRVAELLDASHIARSALCHPVRLGPAPVPWAQGTASVAGVTSVAGVASAAGVASVPGPASSLEVIVSSFDPAALDQFRRHSPGTTMALLLEQGDDWRCHLGRAEGLSAVNPEDAMATSDLFALAAAQGLAVIPWTVDSAGRAVALAALGAAGLITNRPRALLKALNRD